MMHHKFMSRWTAHKLDQLGSVGRGRSRHRPRNEPSLYGGEYPFFQTGDVKSANLYLSEYSQTYNEKGLSQSKQWEVGTLCITIAANIADTAILGTRGCFPDSIIGFVVNPTKADVRFIKYYIDLIKIDMQQVSHGTTQDNLSLEKLLRFDFIVPDLRLQRKIAAILSAYDDLIENNLQRIKILEEMAQNLYREWFVKFRFPGHQNTRLVNSSLGKIPAGWEVTTLGKWIEQRKDKFKEDIDLKLPLLDLSKMLQRTLSVGETGNPDELSTSRIVFEEDDILFNSIRPYLYKVALAPFRGVTNVSVFVLRPAQKNLQSYLAVLLSSIDTIQWADQHSTGTKMPVIKWEALLAMPMLMPVQEVLRTYEATVQPMLQTVKIVFSHNTNLRNTRALLLPKLISGEVDVSALDIAIPEETAA